MGIEGLSELVPVRSFFEKMPSGRKPGQAVHPAIVTRAIKRGNLTPDGRRVRLTATKLGGIWFTSRENFDSWVDEVSGRSELSTSSEVKRSQAAEAAGRELGKLGC